MPGYVIGVLIAASLLGAFITYLLVVAILAKNKRSVSAAPRKNVDEEKINLYVNKLVKMLQCKTVYTDDHKYEQEFVNFREVLKNEFPLIHKHGELMMFDGCLVYKVAGKDATKNILLMSHHDVVDATGEWEHEGFGGEVADGKIWGRGTVDTKTPLFAEFSALEELLNEGFNPPCNVWIGSSHNEEIGGDGIPTALKYFQKNNITFEVILDEGGALIEPPLGGMKADKCGMVAVHEKGRISLICTANANSNPASLTSGDKLTPVERMSSFINEITTNDARIILKTAAGQEFKKHMEGYEFSENPDLFLKKVNELRVKEGASSLKLSKELCDVARLAAEEYAVKTGTAFTREDGSYYYTLLDENGISYNMADKIIIPASFGYKETFDEITKIQQSQKALCSKNFKKFFVCSYSSRCHNKCI